MTRGELARLVRASLREMDLRTRVREAASGLHGPVRVIAIGKAAPEMTTGALEALGRAASAALVVTNDGTEVAVVRASARRLGVPQRVLFASHPLPDRRSVAAGRACLALAATHGEGRGTLLVLVSGGASSLVCAPAAGITLAEKRAVAKRMLASGADVRAINVVRKHLSRIKGGGLARAALPDRVVSIIASDVVGGEPSDVGSGPAVADPSTVRDARRLLARFAEDHAGLPLARTLSPRDAGGVEARVVVSPEQLARVADARLRAAGLRVRVLAPSTGDAATLAAEYVALARRARPGTAFVRAAEPGVVVPTKAGRGGRSSHVAALVGRALGPRHVLFAAVATDGVDGASGTAGAIVDERFASRVSAEALARAIARFDTGPLHLAARTALPARPTGQNLADLHVLVVG